MPPLVSVLILSRQRPDRLRSCLAHVAAQDHPAVEVHVLANGCDETESLVRREFPEVVLHAVAENIGCVPGRNLLARRVGGDYLLFLDDDGELRDPTSVSRLVAEAAADPRAGVLSMALLNAVSDEPTGWRRTLGGLPFTCYHASFAGGACLMRRAAFLGAGGYTEAFVGYGEEFDLTIRLYATGFAVRHFPEVAFHHFVDKGPSAWRQQVSLGYRHLQYTIRRLYPGPYSWPASMKALLTHLYVYSRQLRGRRPFEELREAMRWAAKGRRVREPVSRRSLELCYYAKYFRVSDWEELARAPRGLLARVPLLRLKRKLLGVSKLTR